MATAETLQTNRYEQVMDRETRIRNDATTWLAETLNGSMRTNFEFYSNGSELFGEDGEALRSIFDNAIRAAHLMVERNPSVAFELRRRIIERGELSDMEDMVNGQLYTDKGEAANTLVVVSDFPPELMDLPEAEDVDGYNTGRKQTMLRVIALEPDGAVSITTQSLDRSDRQALEDIYRALGREPQPGELLGQRVPLALSHKQQGKLADRLTQVYDDGLAHRLRGKWHAGTLKDKKRLEVDTYKFACEQHDLIDFFTRQKLMDPLGAERWRYKLAATANARYDKAAGLSEKIMTKTSGEFVPGQIHPASLTTYRSVSAGQGLMRELDREGSRAAARGKSFSGCGVTSEAEDEEAGQSSTVSRLKRSGYGNSSKEDSGDCEFESEECPNCHEKKVWTRVRKIYTKAGEKTHISGSCGCSVTK